MNGEKSILWRKLQGKSINRRTLIKRAAKTAAGTGLLLGSGLHLSAFAQDEAVGNKCKPVPRPIPHITSPPGAHFFFPGPVDADAATSPNAGHDPSLITDFSGVIANADMIFSGKGTNLNTGQTATYDFHADMRVMSGVFVALDNEQHKGTFGFI